MTEMKSRRGSNIMFSCLRKTCILTILVVLSQAVRAESTQGPETLYEMVPHVVLPQSIQYKPMPTSLSNPGVYTAFADYPAAYTAYPSYVLPYPTEMRSVQQTVYPITQVAHQPEPIVFPKSESPTQQAIIVIPAPQNEEEQSLETRPIPALPKSIRKVHPVREIDVYAEPQTEKSENNETEPMEFLRMNFSDSIEAFLSRKTVPIASQFGQADYSLIQWSSPCPAPYNAGPFANATLNGSPVNPTAAVYGNTNALPPYANPQGQPAATDPANIAGSAATTPGLNQDVVNQIEQLLQKNPNMQFSVVMMGPNGQIIPLNGGTPVQAQQQGSPQQGVLQQQQANPTQQLQTQMQYVQAMNQYLQRLNSAQPNNQYGQAGSPYSVMSGQGYYGGYTPYVQPIPGSQGDCALANPYYLAMYRSLYDQQQIPSPYGMNYGGYGPMYNPYLPAPQGYYGTIPNSDKKPEQEKSFWDRMKERRKKSEKQMCDAWRSPHYPEETGMRLPAKNAYPWGYFGSHVAPTETANFGGYYDMYRGTNTTPGL